MTKKPSGWGGPRTAGPGKKMGRPKGSTGPRLPSPRRKQIAVRLDEAENAAFRALCREMGLTPSDRIRWHVLEDIRKAMK